MMKGAGSVGREEIKSIYAKLDARRAVKRANELGRLQRVTEEKYGGWHNIGEEEVNGGSEV